MEILRPKAAEGVEIKRLYDDIAMIGMAMAIINYPIYKKILAGRKAKYSDKIIALSDELIRK